MKCCMKRPECPWIKHLAAPRGWHAARSKRGHTSIPLETRLMNPLSFGRRALCVAALAAAMPAFAQGKWPEKPVTVVVPYAAGGGTDIVARSIGQRLSEMWGKQVVVDNRTGANGVVGSSYVAKAAPDGHT